MMEEVDERENNSESQNWDRVTERGGLGGEEARSPA